MCTITQKRTTARRGVLRELIWREEEIQDTQNPCHRGESVNGGQTDSPRHEGERKGEVQRVPEKKGDGRVAHRAYRADGGMPIEATECATPKALYKSNSYYSLFY